jgi:16S rRNA (adenine1518-N6/adenine1519-N6)-dimethyltransferase
VKAKPPSAILAQYGLRAKKSWGQNFLVDDGVYRKIVDACLLEREDRVIEIGAGLGTLTLRLAERAGRVVAVERDRDLAAVLRAELGARPEIEVREANALDLDYAAERTAGGGRRLVVAGNLPYQIATPLLLRLVQAREHIVRAVVMLQLEVARRLVAAPDTEFYGSLSVALQTYADVSLRARVGRSAFLPPPKVESAVVVFEPLLAPRVPLRDPGLFEGVVRAAFGQRRKTLRNALRAVLEEEILDDALRAAGIEGGRRGETLGIAEFAQLAEALSLRGGALRA